MSNLLFENLKAVNSGSFCSFYGLAISHLATTYTEITLRTLPNYYTPIFMKLGIQVEPLKISGPTSSSGGNFYIFTRISFLWGCK